MGRTRIFCGPWCALLAIFMNWLLPSRGVTSGLLPCTISQTYSSITAVSSVGKGLGKNRDKNSQSMELPTYLRTDACICLAVLGFKPGSLNLKITLGSNNTCTCKLSEVTINLLNGPDIFNHIILITVSYPTKFQHTISIN